MESTITSGTGFSLCGFYCLIVVRIAQAEACATKPYCAAEAFVMAAETSPTKLSVA
jgi:hypothetical protein